MFEKMFGKSNQVSDREKTKSAIDNRIVAGLGALTMFLQPFSAHSQETKDIATLQKHTKALYQEYAKQYGGDTWLSVNNEKGNAVFGSNDVKNKSWLHYEAPVDTVVINGKTYLQGTVIHFNDDNNDGLVDEATVVISKKLPGEVGPNGYYKTPVGNDMDKLKIETNPDMNKIQEKYSGLVELVVKNGEIVEK